MSTTVMDIDALLGDKSTRFFGSRYKSVIPQLKDIILLPLSPEQVDISGSFKIGTPDVWSKKNHNLQRQHLSTIDLIIVTSLISKKLFEKLSTFGYYPENIKVLAGNSPQENDLENIKFIGNFSKSQDSTTLSLDIQDFKVRVLYRQQGESVWDELNSLINSWDIREIVLKSDQESYGKVLSRTGIAQSYSAVDAFVSTLQLGQALLYSLDNIQRKESNTLWMRSTEILFPPEDPLKFFSSHALRVDLENPRIVIKDGKKWRLGTIVTKQGSKDINIKCSVAHQLPATTIMEDKQ